MGRAMRASLPCSERSGDRSKKIAQVRTKRKKRKRDLEELHRNVLEAKRNMRFKATQDSTKWKTNFSKVLNNFADKRRDNEEVNQGVGNGKSKRTKSRTICERLLPEPMVGMYQNGAKGREIRRAVGRLNETNVARLRGNVLKLLKGEETNPKSSRKRKEIERKGANSDVSSGESDSETAIGRLVKGSPLLVKAKGVKRTDCKKTRIITVPDETRAKDQLDVLSRQRDENKCKRRLFEPDEEDEPAKNSFRIIDRSVITDGEIRFSPNRIKNADNDVENMSTETAERTDQDEGKNSMTKRLLGGALASSNFWGWSPVLYYEKLCAMISIDNFENKRHQRQRAPDRVVKIQSILTRFYLKNGQRSQLVNPRKLSGKPEVMRAARKSFPTSSQTDEIQGCTEDSEMDEDSSLESSTIMIGSWHPENLQRLYEDSSVFEEKMETPSKARPEVEDRDTRRDAASAPVHDDDEKGHVSSSDIVKRTIDSVAEFFRAFEKNDRANRKDRGVLEMEVDQEGRGANEDVKRLDVCPETPCRDSIFVDKLGCLAPRRIIKHVPTILRRSNGQSEPMDVMEQDEDPRGFFPANGRRRVEKQRVPGNVNLNLPPVNHHHHHHHHHHQQQLVHPAPKRENQSIKFSTTPHTSSLRQETNYHHHHHHRRRTPSRETSKILVEEQLLEDESKLNFVRGNYEPTRDVSRVPSSGEIEERKGEDYEEGFSDRKIETTSRAFVKALNMANKAGRSCLDQEEVDDHESSQRRDEAEGDGGKRVIFFNASDGFSDPRSDGNVERFEPSIRRKSNDLEGTKKPRKILSDLSYELHRDDQQIPRRFSSFDVTLPADSKLLPRGEVTTNSRVALTMKNFANKRVFREPERYVERKTRVSNQPIESLGVFQQLANFYQNPVAISRVDREFREPGPRHPRGVIKKPVVLFKPIEETRKKTVIPSRDPRSQGNSETMAMREAVRSLRVMAFDNNPEEFSSSTRPSHLVCDRQVTNHDREWPVDKPRTRVETYSQPSKYLASERTIGKNPRRIPIYERSDVTGLEAPEILKIIEPENTIYVRFRETARNREDLNDQLIGQQREIQRRDASIEHGRFCNNAPGILARSKTDGRTIEQRSRRVALMIPAATSTHFRQTSNNTRPTSGLPDRERSCPPTRFEHQPNSIREPFTAMTRETQRYEMNFDESRELDDPPERIQLPDGRIVMVVPENSSQCFDPNTARSASLRVNGQNLEIRRRCYEMANDNEIVFSQPQYRWNVDYDGNKAYGRLTRTNGVPGTFPAV